jgi:hypothetical protein
MAHKLANGRRPCGSRPQDPGAASCGSHRVRGRLSLELMRTIAQFLCAVIAAIDHEKTNSMRWCGAVVNRPT